MINYTHNCIYPVIDSNNYGYWVNQAINTPSFSVTGWVIFAVAAIVFIGLFIATFLFIFDLLNDDFSEFTVKSISKYLLFIILDAFLFYYCTTFQIPSRYEALKNVSFDQIPPAVIMDLENDNAKCN